VWGFFFEVKLELDGLEFDAGDVVQLCDNLKTTELYPFKGSILQYVDYIFKKQLSK
jgi:hypothetical protein